LAYQPICKHYNGKLIIAIDELDKVHDVTQVQGLLSEIKGALSVEGTYYLLSISEDAASSFRTRLFAGRDIFESTFDEIYEVTPMDLAGAEAMLQARIEQGRRTRTVFPCRRCLSERSWLAGFRARCSATSERYRMQPARTPRRHVASARLRIPPDVDTRTASMRTHAKRIRSAL